MAITTRDGEAALRWLRDNWDDATQVATAGPVTTERLGAARQALADLLQLEDSLRDLHEQASKAAPMSSNELTETTKVARMLMEGKLAPSPFMTISFARALVTVDALWWSR